MNVIIANKYQTMLQSLDIDVIKVLNGEFAVEEIIASFQNFYFQRMILDITAIKGYKDIKVLQKLSISLDMDKVILLLDDSEQSSSSLFLSKIISMGIYNFTRNMEGILYLYNNPNTYRDVAHMQQLESEIQVPVASGLVGSEVVQKQRNSRIIGIKNASKECGATTLSYLMLKELEATYKVVAIEVDKRDFHYFKRDNMFSTTSASLDMLISKHADKDVIIIDMNGSRTAETQCDIVIYLLEPSILKINRMLMISSRALKDLENKKIVFNRSLFEEHEIREFEKESGLKVFYNIGHLNDRNKKNPEVARLLIELGFDRVSS